jgi:hypothetical protein
MKFGNKFWLILFREHIIPKLFAVRDSHDPLFILETLPDLHGKELLPPFKPSHLELRFSLTRTQKNKNIAMSFPENIGVRKKMLDH